LIELEKQNFEQNRKKQSDSYKFLQNCHKEKLVKKKKEKICNGLIE